MVSASNGGTIWDEEGFATTGSIGASNVVCSSIHTKVVMTYGYVVNWSVHLKMQVEGKSRQCGETKNGPF